MGEGPARVSAARDPGEAPAKEVDMVAAETWRLTREIHATRGDMDRYLDELQRRRRELMDVPLQVRRHPALVFGLVAAVVAAAGGTVLRARRARKRSADSRARRALDALGILGSMPLAAVGVPLGVALAKGLLRGRTRRASRP